MPISTPFSFLLDNDQFGHYTILRQQQGALWILSQSVSGTTFKGIDNRTQRPVAIRLFNPKYFPLRSSKTFFIDRMKTYFNLRHPNIATGYEIGEVDEKGFIYTAVEFVDGLNLSTFVTHHGALPLDLTLATALQISRALFAAQSAAILHLDIRPPHLMLVKQHPQDELYYLKMLDFGLSDTLFQTNHIGGQTVSMRNFTGSAQFASPEQLQEKSTDVRSDLYSVGICLWYMLTGNLPFQGSTFSLYSQQLNKPPPWEQLSSQIPAEVRRILERLLQKDPAQRYQTAKELSVDLEEALKPFSADPEVRKLIEATIEEESVESPQQVFNFTTNTEAPELVGNRFELVELVNEDPISRFYRARDRQKGNRMVAFRMFNRESPVFSTTDLKELENDFRQVQQFGAQPNLVETILWGLYESNPFLVTEWINGFSLHELLERRGKISLPEVLLLLRQAAMVVDGEHAKDLAHLTLDSPRVYIHYSDKSSLTLSTTEYESEAIRFATEGKRKTHPRLGKQLTPFPTFLVKVDPLMPKTMVELEFSKFRYPNLENETGNGVFRLGVFVYELLSGSFPDVTSYIELDVLTREANEVLKQALSTTQEHGFYNGQHFYEVFARACGFDPDTLFSIEEVDTHLRKEGEKHLEPQREEEEEPEETEVTPAASELEMPAVQEEPIEKDLPQENLPAEQPVQKVVEEPPPLPMTTPTSTLPKFVFVVLIIILGICSIYYLHQQERYYQWTPFSLLRPPTPVVVEAPQKEETAPRVLTVPQDYRNIQEAINAAQSGDQILIYPGTYQSPIIFKDGVTLKGVNPIICRITFNKESNNSNALLSVTNATKGSIENLSFDGVQQVLDGVLLENSSVSISNCTVMNAKRNGIRIEGAQSHPNLQHNTVQSNGGFGIRFQQGSQGVAENNTIFTNQAGGILVTGSQTSAQLLMNQIESNNGDGIRYSSAAQGIVSNNPIMGNRGNGINVEGVGTVVTLKQNLCKRNERNGLKMGAGGSGVVEENVFSANKESGILLVGLLNPPQNWQLPTLRNNTCVENQKFGIATSTIKIEIDPNNRVFNNKLGQIDQH